MNPHPSSNLHPRRPYVAQSDAPRPSEHILWETNFIAERKTFRVTLRENSAGKFLRITEQNGHKQSNIILPAPGLPALRDALATVCEATAQP